MPQALADPLRLDIGFGNFNFGTAVHLVKEYLANPAYRDDPFNLRRYEGRLETLYADMRNESEPTLIALVGLKLADAQDFYLNGMPGEGRTIVRDLRSRYLSSTGAERDAWLVMAYRTSYTNIAAADPVTPMFRSGSYNYFYDPRSPYHRTTALFGDGSN